MLNEGIQNNDLNSLITDTISIDQFKSKIGSDENVVVVAFEVMDKDPAKDLSMFLETGHDFLDVDISQGPNKNGKYNVFVELDRDSKLFFNIEKILKDVERVDNNCCDFKFTSYKNTTPTSWSKENFSSRVIDSSLDYVKTYNKQAQEISERIKFLNEY